MTKIKVSKDDLTRDFNENDGFVFDSFSDVLKNIIIENKVLIQNNNLNNNSPNNVNNNNNCIAYTKEYTSKDKNDDSKDNLFIGKEFLYKDLNSVNDKIMVHNHLTKLRNNSLVNNNYR